MWTWNVVDVVGILDVDWKSLMSTSKPSVSVPTDALDRFTPANLFRMVGVSKRYAGPAYTSKVENLTGRCKTLHIDWYSDMLSESIGF